MGVAIIEALKAAVVGTFTLNLYLLTQVFFVGCDNEAILFHDSDPTTTRITNLG